MLRLLCHSLLLAILTLRCCAELCLFNSCVANCPNAPALFPSRCNCPKQCVGDVLGSCSSVQCASPNDDGHTVTVQVITKTGNPTSTTTVYTATSTVYTSTTTVVKVVTSTSVNVVTSTLTNAQASTSYVTIPGPQTTITRRDVDFPLTVIVVREEPNMKRGNLRLNKRTTTITVTTADPGNYCGQSGLIACLATANAIYTQGAVYTYNTQSVYYQNSPTTTYVTTNVVNYVTSTLTAAGNTVVITKPTTGSASPTNAQKPSTTSIPSTTQGPSNTQGGPAGQISNSAQFASSSGADVTVTRPITVYAAAGRLDVERSYAMGVVGAIVWHFLDFLL